MGSLMNTTDEWKQAVADWQGIQDRPPAAYRSRSRGFQVLENNFLERVFGTSHWVMPGVWFLPLIVLCLRDALSRPDLGTGAVFGAWVAGALLWTLVEYALHRWLFHLPPARNAVVREVQYMLHGYHHEFPDDPGRLVAPPILSWPLAVGVALAYWAAFGPWWTALLAGTFTGYLGYDWMHYYTHHAVPKSRFGKFMRRFHLEHHFRTANSQFGLSSPLWDLVFRSFWTTRAISRPGRARQADGPSD